MQTIAQQKEPQIVDCFVIPNRLLRMSHRQHLRLICPRVFSKRPQNRYSIKFKKKVIRIVTELSENFKELSEQR